MSYDKNSVQKLDAIESKLQSKNSYAILVEDSIDNEMI